MSGIHFGLPAYVDSYVTHLWIPAFAGMTEDEVLCKIEYLKRTHFREPSPATELEPDSFGTQQVFSFGVAKQLSGDAGLKRTHLGRRDPAPEISSNLFGLQQFARRDAAKRPTGNAGKRTHLGRRDPASEISSQSLQHQRFLRRKTAKRPTGAAGAKRPTGTPGLTPLPPTRYHASTLSHSGGKKMAAQLPWYQSLFPDLRPLFSKVTQKTTNQQVRYLIKKLQLKPGMSFLDCPCGIGRISIPMTKLGIKVVGIDLCRMYLDELNTKSEKAGLRIETHHTDMRRIDYANRFDAAGNLWTSFGYFESEEDNLLVLKKIFRALKPGGRFCLHVVNRDFIIAHYTDTDWQEFGKVLCTEKRQFNYATSINRGVWTFYKEGQASRHEVNLRMYSYHELIAMFRHVGFEEIEGFGSEKDDPIGRNNMLNWVFGTKPR